MQKQLRKIYNIFVTMFGMYHFIGLTHAFENGSVAIDLADSTFPISPGFTPIYNASCLAAEAKLKEEATALRAKHAATTKKQILDEEASIRKEKGSKQWQDQQNIKRKIFEDEIKRQDEETKNSSSLYKPPHCCSFHYLCCRTNKHIEEAIQQHFELSGGSNTTRNGRTKIVPQQSISSDLSKIDAKLNRARAAATKADEADDEEGEAKHRGTIKRLKKQRTLMVEENATSPPTTTAPEKKKLFRTKTAIDL
jgi:hypothetical protein